MADANPKDAAAQTTTTIAAPAATTVPAQVAAGGAVADPGLAVAPAGGTAVAAPVASVPAPAPDAPATVVQPAAVDANASSAGQSVVAPVEPAKQQVTPDLLGGDPAAKSTDTPVAEPAKDAVVAPVVPAAPASYGDVALPEGVIVANETVYKERIGAFDAKVGALAEKLKLDPETAKQFRNEVLQVGLAEIAALSQKVAQAGTDARAVIQKEIDDAYVAKVSGYRQSFEGDQSLVGIDGTTRETTLWRANAVIDQYAADKGLPAEEAKKQKDALRKDLKESGLINHPGLIRLFRNVANDLVEGTPVPAMKAPEPKKSKAQALYH